MECAPSGAGPAVLLLHGAMGGYDQSTILGRCALGDGEFQSIAVSRPGYLGTPFNGRRLPAQQADLCAALLDELGVHDAAVIAISGGGQAALQFALRHPARCRALVMISACSAPITKRLPLAYYIMITAAKIPALAAAMQRKAAQDPDAATARSIPDAGLREVTLRHPDAGPLFRALQQSTQNRMNERLAGTRNDVAQSRARFAYPLERIDAPTLVIHGTADEAAPYEASEMLASRVPGARLLRIEAGRHVSLFTHLDLVRANVRSFLA